MQTILSDHAMVHEIVVRPNCERILAGICCFLLLSYYEQRNKVINFLRNESIYNSNTLFRQASLNC